MDAHHETVAELQAVGGIAGGNVLAAEAYRRFADHPDPAVASAGHLRTALFRWNTSWADARPLFE